MMDKANGSITKEQNKDRVSVFERLVENWDKLPEYIQGNLNGYATAYANIYLNPDDKSA